MFFPCTGLGRQQRGFETFTRECALALAGDPRLDIHVFAGGDVSDMNATAVWNVPRDSAAAHLVARFVRRDSYFIEQLTFFLAFLPHLVRKRPDVVYFADLNLGNLCWHWRRVSGQQFNLLFYNGGMTTKPFTRTDMVQQLTPEGLAEATARGEDPARQIVLPHGMRIPFALPSRITGDDRCALGLPATRTITLSVGLLGTTIKRMDYLIREIAAMTAPRPFLCLLGAECDETPAVRARATELLGDDGFLMRTVPAETVSRYYRAADVFALCSLREGFGLAYVEALAHGLPIVAHDYPGTRYILGELATLADLTRAGAVSGAIAAYASTPVDENERVARHAGALARFGWDALREQYAQMLVQAAEIRR